MLFGSQSSTSKSDCVFLSRILVQSGIHDEFASALSEVVKGLKLGDAFTDGVTQGPLINDSAVEKVRKLFSRTSDKKTL